MTSTDIYRDIAARTGGNIYIGVVGPVRTGKSTFIRKVMEHLVLDEIEDPYLRQRTIDELPQASAGRTIMTTEPKFVPENAIEVHLGDHGKCNIRMVDCVGFVVEGALGQFEENGPRMVLTPWREEEMPFQLAAEIGTQKVINEHSTVSVVVTTDGSIGEISRDEYLEAERKVISEMKKTGKPFVVLLNSMFPHGEQAMLIRDSMERSYGIPVVVKNCNELTADDIEEILSMMLLEFPVSTINVDLPSWITFLPNDDLIKKEIYNCIRQHAENCRTIRQTEDLCKNLVKHQHVNDASPIKKSLGDGAIDIKIKLPDDLFFGMVSKTLQKEIHNDGDLLLELSSLQQMRNEYEKIRSAFDLAKQSGYGIVTPCKADLSLDQPQEYRQGNRFGIKVKATAPTYHIIKADISSEIAPIVGDEEQSQTLLKFMNEKFDENLDEIWDYDIFGKSIYSMVNDGLQGKFDRLPDDARCKLQEALAKILNEGSGGLICIIL